MFFWFVAAAIFSVRFVFQDPRFDYRLLVVGVLLPDAIDIWFGGARVLHTLLFSVSMLVVIMLATRTRKVLRKRLLPLAIGTFMHLIFDGAFTATKVFWWPFGGVSFGDAELPVAQRMGLNVVMEIAGVIFLVVLVRQCGLAHADRRHNFLRTGMLSPMVEEK
ncbi:unannotated protein [freshwater metagenome]|uniref:Unannotated protein n=1 Tax=freshwater metagenome TaxID=449393 RepID=A0A6J7RRT8_9ZZZZ|nr:hypothetical protein [Actinomycetota bacterium]